MKELIGVELDAAVARCEGFNPTIEGDEVWLYPRESTMPLTYNPHATHSTNVICQQFHPSREWADGGPIIEREGLGVSQYNNIPDRLKNRWQCVKYQRGMILGNSQPVCEFGPTLLIAAMRCYIKSKQTN